MLAGPGGASCFLVLLLRRRRGFLVYPEGQMFMLLGDNERFASISRVVMKAEVKGEWERTSVASSQEQRL